MAENQASGVPDKSVHREWLWSRVRNLIEQTILTLERGEPNIIAEVSERSVRVYGRRTRVGQAHVFRVYEALLNSGEYRHGDAQRFTWALAPAIVLMALPDQVEKIVDDGRAGIRVRRGVRLGPPDETR